MAHRMEQAVINELTVGKLFNYSGLEITPGANPSGAMDYYVDGNRTLSGRGRSWKKAFKTFAEAVTASDAAMALGSNRWWAKRNRIFIEGDVLTEDIVKFPTKCDVLGLGSYDANDKPGLYGHHAPVGESYGTRFINIHLRAKAHASPVITLTNATSGLKTIGCTFDGTLGTMTSGILATASPFLEVIGCEFIGTFVTSYITFGAGEAGRTRIIGNHMLGTAAKGIVASGMTASWIPLIKGNIIRATGQWIDDDTDLFSVIDNRGITDIDTTTSTAGYDFNLQLAAGNIQMGVTGLCDSVPFMKIAE